MLAAHKHLISFPCLNTVGGVPELGLGEAETAVVRNA